MSFRRQVFAAFQPLVDIALFILVNTALFFAARLALLYFLLPDITERGHIPHALYIGLKFDARMAVFMTLPLAFCLLWPRLERAVSREGASTARRVLCLVTGIMAAGAMLIHIFDFGFFFYLHQHIDMGARVFLEDPSESVLMVWQSYPVLLIAAAFAACVALYVWLFSAFLRTHVPFPIRPKKGGEGCSRKWRAFVTVSSLVMLFVVGYGQISSNFFPLRWSNAYFSSDKNIALLAVNPIQNLFDTRNFGKAIPPNEAATREAWPRMAAYLRVPEGQPPLTYLRHFPGREMEKYSLVPVIAGHCSRPSSFRVWSFKTPDLTTWPPWVFTEKVTSGWNCPSPQPYAGRRPASLLLSIQVTAWVWAAASPGVYSAWILSRVTGVVLSWKERDAPSPS